MRFMNRALGIACFLAAAIAPTTLLAQFRGPVLGFVSDDGRTTIRPIWGVPGASTLGDSLQLETPVRLVTVSPQQQYALAVQEDGQLSLIDFSQDVFTSQPIAGLPDGAENVVISPAGSAAAAYAQPGILRILAGLPRTPRFVRDLDLSGIPGNLVLIGVSDDGSLALIKSTKLAGSADDEGVETETALWVVDSASNLWRVPAERPAAAVFLPNRSDIVVADDASGDVFLIRDIGRSYDLVSLTRATTETGSFSTISTSADGRLVFLGASTSGNVLITDITSGFVALLSCGCSPTTLDPLKGTSVFRLTEASNDPIFVLDASAATPRIVMVPPKISQ